MWAAPHTTGPVFRQIQIYFPSAFMYWRSTIIGMRLIPWLILEVDRPFSQNWSKHSCIAQSNNYRIIIFSWKTGSCRSWKITIPVKRRHPWGFLSKADGVALNEIGSSESGGNVGCRDGRVRSECRNFARLKSRRHCQGHFSHDIGLGSNCKRWKDKIMRLVSLN